MFLGRPLFLILSEVLWILVLGFEAGGPNTPSNIDPWSIIGNESLINIETEHVSCMKNHSKKKILEKTSSASFVI